MTLRDALLQELDLETPYTRRTLERVPIDKAAWKPHDKSITLGWLATFIASCPSWGVKMLEVSEFDPFAAGSGGGRPPMPKNTEELLALFDLQHGALRGAIAATNDQVLAGEFTLKPGGTVWFTQPRWIALREYILNHIVHHRAQLGVYLRLLGIAVPAIYNDSADEKGGVFREPAPLIGGGQGRIAST